MHIGLTLPLMGNTMTLIDIIRFLIVSTVLLMSGRALLMGFGQALMR